MIRLLACLAFLESLCTPMISAGQAVPVSVAQPSPSPATKLEGFKPSAGSVVTVGYTEMGGVSGITVDARELKDARGLAVRGLLVEVFESQYRHERSFVDADEIPELLKGIDALLGVTINPTRFSSFEVRYTTKGELELTAYNNDRNEIAYAVHAGRGIHASSYIDLEGMRKLRELFAAAAAKLK